MAIVLSGCQPTGRSVVLDLDAVAKATGRDVLIGRAVESATHQLNAQLVQAARDMDEEIKQLQVKIGTSPTPQQQVELQRARARAQQNIQNNKLVAETARNRVRAEQIVLFRNEVRPIAAEIARQHNAEIVIIPNDNVVWHATSVDITGEVITQWRARPTPATPPRDETSTSSGTNEQTSGSSTNAAEAKE
ncbi:MAG TPA: OmpH family outer membrane protein [Verrucomicrobiae bacterium]|nr:OmpH family outer membrane protein [Verrucomicrobiae bacterium]